MAELDQTDFQAKILEFRQLLALRHFNHTGKKTQDLLEPFKSLRIKPTSNLFVVHSKVPLNNTKVELIEKLVLETSKRTRILDSKLKGDDKYPLNVVEIFEKICYQVQSSEEYIDHEKVVFIELKTLLFSVVGLFHSIEAIIILPECTVSTFELIMIEKTQFSKEIINRVYDLIEQETFTHLFELSYFDIELETLFMDNQQGKQTVTVATISYDRLTNPFNNNQNLIFLEVFDVRKTEILKATDTIDGNFVHITLLLKSQDPKVGKTERFHWGNLEIVDKVEYCDRCYSVDECDCLSVAGLGLS